MARYLSEESIWELYHCITWLRVLSVHSALYADPQLEYDQCDQFVSVPTHRPDSAPFVWQPACSGTRFAFYSGNALVPWLRYTNQITFVSPTAFDKCTALTHLYLYYNPLGTVRNISVETLKYLDVRGEYLACDSRLLWVKDAAQRGVTVPDFTCAGPPSLQGTSFNGLTREEVAAVGKSQHVHDADKELMPSFYVMWLRWNNAKR